MATNPRLAWEIQWIEAQNYRVLREDRLVANLEDAYAIRAFEKQLRQWEQGILLPHAGVIDHVNNQIARLKERIIQRGIIQYEPMPANTPRSDFWLYQTLTP
jgi:thymidylate synthase